MVMKKIVRYLHENKPMTLLDYLGIFGISTLLIGFLLWIAIKFSETIF